MTTPSQSKPNPVPAILVYGTPSGPAFTQASWFRAEDKEAVRAAAQELKLSIIELQTDADKALAAGAHEGVLKGSAGRMIIGSVSAEVYRRIEEHVRKAAGAPDPPSRRSSWRRQPNPRQNKTRTSARRVQARRNLLAQHRLRRPPTSRTARLLEKRCALARGSWPPTGARSVSSTASGSPPSSKSTPVSSRSNGSNSPGYPAFKSRPQDIAVPHPEFRVSGK